MFQHRAIIRVVKSIRTTVAQLTFMETFLSMTLLCTTATHYWMFLCHGLNEADQVLLLWALQLQHHGKEAVEATVDGIWLSGID